MNSTVNRERVVAFISAFYAGDAAAAQACCADDYTSITYAPIDIFPHLGHKQGKEWLPEAIQIQMERYKERRCEIVDLLVDGDGVLAVLRIALHKHSDGRVVRLDTAEVFSLRDGLIVRHRAFFDSLDLIQQLLGHDLTDAFAASVRGAMTR